LVPRPVRGTGTIYLLTWLYQGPPALGVTYPYPVVTVELDEQAGLRLTSTVTGVEDGAKLIGSRVHLTWITLDKAPMPVFALSDEPR